MSWKILELSENVEISLSTDKKRIVNGTNMKSWHKQTIQNLKRVFNENLDYLAFIVGGSVARGDARDDSDVDYLIIVSDRLFAESKKGWKYHSAYEYCAPPCTEANGLMITKKCLKRLMRKGNEPTRWALKKISMEFCRDSEIQKILEKISTYPIGSQQEKIEGFYSQVKGNYMLLKKGLKSSNNYLIHHCIDKIVFFSARLILADNKMLYPNRKWLMSEVEKAVDKPDKFNEYALELLSNPGLERAKNFIERVFNYKNYPEPSGGWLFRFHRENIFRYHEKSFYPLEEL
ncbi:nucleotidyltransferase domain-containing protein [Candidatus Riflebacteria bacterium]